jgi:FlaA1/EpsC-like NDP-sugar epimerase
LDAALKYNVDRFVLISTDKAVSPCSVYGYSKMICEKLVLEAAAKAQKTQAIMFVRFGNVLGSRGSILPIFQNQIKMGGPITVTDENMERFFMTIPEACSLVLQTGGVGKNGQSYLLDMGEPIKILDLAKQIIKFSGLEPYKDIDIKIVGCRKGERLIEPLWLEEEKPTATEYKKLLTLENKPYDSHRLDQLIEELDPICHFTDGFEQDFRNKEKLLKSVCDDCESLQSFYEEIKTTDRKQTDLL